MNDWKVLDVAPIAECCARTGKASLKGKWVDVNKGDLVRPVILCRWVAKEFATLRGDPTTRSSSYDDFACSFRFQPWSSWTQITCY